MKTKSQKSQGREQVRGWVGTALTLATVGAWAGCAPAGIDSQQADSVPQAVEISHNTVAAAGSCEIHPPFQPTFQPQLVWAWTGSPIMPNHKDVMMTPVVVDVNGDGIPDVVFSTYSGANTEHDGILRAVSGADGSDIWAVTDPAYRVRAVSSIAAGDIDNDGLVELCTVPEDGHGFICFENTGAFKFRTQTPDNIWGGPSFADMDGDGKVEIIDGNEVFDNNGVRKWAGIDGPGGPFTGPISFAADIDNDGKQELITGRSIYRYNGTLKCVNNSIGYKWGLSGVGNFNDDPNAEIVFVANGQVTMMDSNCKTLWVRDIPGGGLGGAPNIADFDNDGKPEIGVAGGRNYVVFKGDGTLLWSSPSQDLSSGVTGSSSFDFEGDGKYEVVYADEKKLRIYDGATGAIRFEAPHSSGTTYEVPVIADVDGDNTADIVIPENSLNHGIRVWRDANHGWVGSRGIWNQHAYSVTNVNDNGTIPAHPTPNWLTPGLNTFRANGQGVGVGRPYAIPDLTTSTVASTCSPDGTTVTISAKVKNQGDVSDAGGAKVAFYKGNPASGGTLLGVQSINHRIAIGEEVPVSLTVNIQPGGDSEVWVVADDDGTGHGHQVECNEANNGSSATANLSCNRPPVALCKDVNVTLEDSVCGANASVNNGSYDPDNNLVSCTQSPAGPFCLGESQVVLTCTDTAGLTSTCTAKVKVSGKPPSVNLCGTPPYTNQAKQHVGAYVTPQTPGAVIVSAAFRVNGGPPIYLTPREDDGSLGTDIILVEGPNIITLTAIDTYGATTVATEILTLDTIAPKISFTTPAAGAVFGSTQISATVAVDDKTPTTLKLQEMYGASFPTGSGNFSALVDVVNTGNQTLWAEVTDAAGNTSYATVQVLVDFSVPSFWTNLDSGGRLGPQAGNQMPFRFYVEAVLGTHVITTGGSTFTLPRGGGIVDATVPLVEGVNTLTASATSETGITGTLTRTVIYDLTAPTGTVSIPGTSAVSGFVRITANATDNLTGVREIWFDVDGEGTVGATPGAGNSFTAPLDTTDLDDGTHTLHMTMTDGVGNSVTKSSTFTVKNH